MGTPANSVRGVTERLTETFKRLLPLHLEYPKGGRKPTVSDMTQDSAKALVEFYKTARVERERNSLGIIGRARVAFGVQQQLLAAGYPPSLVKQVLFAMLTSAFVGGRQ